MLLKKHLCFTLFLFALTHSISAQMEISTGALPPYDPTTLIQDVLLGEGVEIISIQYDGSDAAVGYFNDAQAQIGLDEGIVLTTGVAASENADLGIAEPGSMQASANNGSTATDPDIEALADNESIFDLTKYTITFRPSSDRLSFRYVFASEEYPEFGCTAYNDFFGFFISGPGFSGAYENGGENIALIPGTNLEVSINNVHPQNPLDPSCTPDFENFFNDNDGSNNLPVYDGYLDVFTAEATVIPCEEYTIKLVIADIGDAQRDSGVFFEAKSFNSQGFQVAANSQALDGSLVEGCTEGLFEISIAEPATSDLIIDYQMVGDAVNGVDYQLISGEVSIEAGGTSVSIPVIPLNDSNIEGIESIGLDIQINNCTRDTFFLYVRDPALETPDLGEDQSICAGESVNLDGTINTSTSTTQTFSSTSPPLIILGPLGANPPTPAYMNIEVAGFYPPELRPGMINSVCMNIDHSAVEDLDIYLFAPNGTFILLTSDNGGTGDDYINTCFTPDASLAINDPANAAPFTGSFLPEGNFENLWFGDSPVNGTWRLMAIDDESAITGAIQDWSITFNSVYEIEYSWSPTTGLSCTDCPAPTASPTETTTYTLTIEDSFGCQTSDEVEIDVIEMYEAPIINCAGADTESITFDWSDVNGATGYEVSIDGTNWTTPNNGSSSHIVSGLSIGESVTLQVRGTGPCGGNIAVQVCETLDCTPFSVNSNFTPPSCNGASDASIDLSANGTNGGYMYTLNGDPSTTNSTGLFENLAAAEYTISITDALGCSQPVTIEVTEPTALSSSVVLNNNIDCDNNTGSATATGSGGSASFSYNWSNGDTGADLTADSEGWYYVTISDDANCSTLDSIEIITIGGLAATASGDLICPGSSDGMASVSVTQGTEPIDFQWDNNAANQTTATATGLSAGDYMLTITDADNCELILSVTIDEYAAMTLSTSAVDASCGGSDGEASVQVTGGTSDFTYTWNTVPVQNTATATGLSAGEYFVTITDANLCQVDTSVVINTPSSITLSDISTTNNDCFGDSNGSVTLTATNGTPPLMYSLNSVSQDNGNFSNLAAGDYTMVVNDAAGCSSSFPFQITENTEINSDTLIINDLDCSNPAANATVTVSGGSGDYDFLWSNSQTDSILNVSTSGAYYVTISDEFGCEAFDTLTINQSEILTLDSGSASTCANSDEGFAYVEILSGTAPYSIIWDAAAGSVTTDTAYNLSPGTYEVTITDSGNCEEILSLTVNEFPSMTLSTDSTPADCNGTPDGTATVSVTGGTSDFSYAWNTSPEQNTQTATGLSAGLYSVTVSDANGCTSTANATVSTPSMLSIDDISSNAVSCPDGDDGTATVSVSGGTGDFSYTWSTTPIQNTSTATNLSPGDYTVEVSDEAGCTVSAMVTVNNTAPISLDFSVVDVFCANDATGSIDLSVTGAVEPINYAWDNSETSQDLSNLSAGTYTVVIIDANGCTAEGNATVNTSAPIDLDFTVSDASCYGYEDASIETQITGGTAPYNYTWSNGAQTSDLTDVAAGTYEVTVTDANGCGILEVISINQPAVFTATVAVEGVLCAGDENGSLAVTPIGGQPDYLYSIDGENFGSIAFFQNLPSASYDVSVMDGSGCIYDTTGVFIPSPSPFSVDLGDDQEIELGDRAFMDALVGGGTGTATFDWTTEDIAALSCEDCADPYLITNFTTDVSVLAIDENGCTAEDIVSVFVKKNYNVFVPNAFTPDADGVNDLFMPYSKPNTFITSMQIFDRWGNQIFEAQDFYTLNRVGWDGKYKDKIVDTGVYVYWIEALFPDGATALFKGDVTVLK